MNKFISYPPYSLNDAAKLTYALCQQLPSFNCSLNEMLSLTKLGHRINDIAAKYELTITPQQQGVNLSDCCINADSVAKQLVEKGIIDEYKLRAEIENLR